MVRPVAPTSTAWALESLLIFGTVSAAIGTFMAIALGGAGFPLELLDGTPFSTPTIPGLILGVGVGGTQLLAAVTLLRRSRAGLLWSAVAATAMLIWIFTEVAMLDGFQWLQAFYFAVGLGEMLLVLALLGIRPSVAEAGVSAPSEDHGPVAW